MVQPRLEPCLQSSAKVGRVVDAQSVLWHCFGDYFGQLILQICCKVFPGNQLFFETDDAIHVLKQKMLESAKLQVWEFALAGDGARLQFVVLVCDKFCQISCICRCWKKWSWKHCRTYASNTRPRRLASIPLYVSQNSASHFLHSVLTEQPIRRNSLSLRSPLFACIYHTPINLAQNATHLWSQRKSI